MANQPSTTEVLAATIGAAVERQLTQYVSTMSQQVEAAKAAADAARAEMKQSIDALNARLDQQQGAADGYQNALRSALEERLGAFAEHQAATQAAVEARLAALPAMLMTDLAMQMGTSAEATEQLEQQHAALSVRVDELHRSARRFDEQASALVQHVNDTTTALSRRMDEGDQGLAIAVEERLATIRASLDELGPDVQRQLAEQLAMLQTKLDGADSRTTDRMLAMEERVNEQAGTKIAGLEATIGRIGSGFDDSMIALSQRMLELENHLHDTDDRMKALAEQVGKVDENAINEVKEQLSSAIGEAMLVRIELDRVVSSTDEKLDKQGLRMAEIEAQLADEMDLSAVVQLERLEELERALVALDPDQFVRKNEVGAAPSASTGAARVDPNPTPSSGLTLPSTSLNPTLPPSSALNATNSDSSDIDSSEASLSSH